MNNSTLHILDTENLQMSTTKFHTVHCHMYLNRREHLVTNKTKASPLFHFLFVCSLVSVKSSDEIMISFFSILITSPSGMFNDSNPKVCQDVPRLGKMCTCRLVCLPLGDIPTVFRHSGVKHSLGFTYINFFTIFMLVFTPC